MNTLTPLESSAILAIAKELVDENASFLREALGHASVLSRQNTSGGFYTTLSIDTSRLNVGRRHLGESVYIAIEGLELGIGMILHLESDISATLEGYAVGPEDTSDIAFGNARFAIIVEPGPLPTNGR